MAAAQLLYPGFGQFLTSSKSRLYSGSDLDGQGGGFVGFCLLQSNFRPVLRACVAVGVIPRFHFQLLQFECGRVLDSPAKRVCFIEELCLLIEKWKVQDAGFTPCLY